MEILAAPWFAIAAPTSVKYTHEIIIFLNKSSPPTILQERVITDLKEGSAILEQQLSLMDVVFVIICTIFVI